MTPDPMQAMPEQGVPPRRTQGLLAIWHDVEAGFEPAVDAWYDRQHHLERVAIPGFVRARRYLNLGTGPRYFSRYDVDDAAVLQSAPYLAALNHPTPWTRTIMPRYRNTLRAVFRLAGGSGRADGADLVTLRISGGDAQAARGLRDGELAALVDASGVLRVEVWRIDDAASSVLSEEKNLRGTADEAVGLAILVEGSDIDRVSDAVARHLLPRVAVPATIDRYRWVFQAQKH